MKKIFLIMLLIFLIGFVLGYHFAKTKDCSKAIGFIEYSICVTERSK